MREPFLRNPGWRSFAGPVAIAFAAVLPLTRPAWAQGRPEPVLATGPAAAAGYPSLLPAGIEEPGWAEQAAPVRAFGDSRDHRWEGLVLGAIGVGLVGAVMADALCTPDSASDGCTGPVIGTGLVSAVVGGVLGGFIGSAIPKRTAAGES